ncbi:MAG: DUF2306 domain-containing protein [Gammaproteobacteria bacterium]|nr:DUF2306 domain-containing protein [Gammaproteobacteria bacterium]
MNFEPLVSAPLPILIHFFTIVPAFVLGAGLLLVSRKGSAGHRFVGKVYLALLAVTAVAAIFIRSPPFFPALDVGPLRLSPIHLFVPMTVWGLWSALATVRRGDLKAHREAMIGLYAGGLLVAGALAFLPGRILWRMLFA